MFSSTQSLVIRKVSRHLNLDGWTCFTPTNQPNARIPHLLAFQCGIIVKLFCARAAISLCSDYYRIKRQFPVGHDTWTALVLPSNKIIYISPINGERIRTHLPCPNPYTTSLV
jgi:hypothetical protein